MAKDKTTTVTGEFDHTQGVYRLTVEVPMSVILELNYSMGRSTAETMLWVGELITNQANALIAEEEMSNPMKGFGNERFSG